MEFAGMTDSEPSNHWDSLAEQLGAEPTPPEPAKPPPEVLDEAEGESGEASAHDTGVGVTDQSVRDASLAPPPPVRPKPAPRKAEKPSPAHWASLAGQLGLEVPDEPAAEAEGHPESEGVGAGLGDQAPAVEDTPPAVWSDTAMTATPDEPVASDDESTGSQAARQAASLEFGFGIIDVVDTRDQSFIDEAEEAVKDEADDESYEPAEAEREPVTTVDETDLAAEDGDATDTAATDEKTKRRKRRRGRKRRPREGQADERREPAAEGSAEPTGQVSADTSDADAATPSAPSDTGRVADSQGPSRKKRRPRRRPIVGMPGAEHPAEVVEDQAAPPPSEDAPPAAAPPSESEPEPDTAPEPEKRPRKGPREREPAAESSGEPESGRPSHRKIPSWSEAIGLVIATNEQARARSAESGGRRRGRGKGRRPSRGKKS
jgi:ribonuclease E